MRGFFLSAFSAMIFIAGTARSQSIPATSAKDLLARITADNDTTYIINFWATWCAPCVKELPEFNKLQEEVTGKPVKVILVSLDFPESYPDKLSRFVDRKHLKPEVWFLAETDANYFIPLFAKEWSGSIPGTLLLAKGGKSRAFLERSITSDEIIDFLHLR